MSDWKNRPATKQEVEGLPKGFNNSSEMPNRRARRRAQKKKNPKVKSAK